MELAVEGEESNSGKNGRVDSTIKPQQPTSLLSLPSPPPSSQPPPLYPSSSSIIPPSKGTNTLSAPKVQSKDEKVEKSSKPTLTISKPNQVTKSWPKPIMDLNGLNKPMSNLRSTTIQGVWFRHEFWKLPLLLPLPPLPLPSQPPPLLLSPLLSSPSVPQPLTQPPSLFSSPKIARFIHVGIAALTKIEVVGEPPPPSLQSPLPPPLPWPPPCVEIRWIPIVKGLCWTYANEGPMNAKWLKEKDVFEYYIIYDAKWVDAENQFSLLCTWEI